MQDAPAPPRATVDSDTAPSPTRLVFPMGVDGRVGLSRFLFSCTLIGSSALCLLTPGVGLSAFVFGPLALIGAAGFAFTGALGVLVGALALMTGETVVDPAAGTIVRHVRFAGFPVETTLLAHIEELRHVEIRRQGSPRFPQYTLLLSGDARTPFPVAAFSREVDAQEQGERLRRALVR